ncbi:hypothetical protein Sjap_005731 [Stephania japonica]|uniref:Cytochrome p450 n=1 Tax=Stephania japonica TaxID=461633 RepID=A0AAP0K4L7_9MAGN
MWVEAWKVARWRREGEAVDQVTQSSIAWEKPSREWMKCNTDATIFSDILQIGVGVVLRDDSGEFVR